MSGSLNYWEDCFSKVLGDWLLRMKILDPILFKYPPTSCCGVDLFSNLSSARQRVASAFIVDSNSVLRMHGEHMDRKSRQLSGLDIPSWPLGG